MYVSLTPDLIPNNTNKSNNNNNNKKCESNKCLELDIRIK